MYKVSNRIFVIIYFILFQHVASDPPTAQSLSKLIQDFIQLQEDQLGRNSKNPPFTRLPVSKRDSVPIFN